MAVTDVSLDMARKAAGDAAGQAVQSKLSGVGNLKMSRMSPQEKEKKLREACDGFESIFIQKMWQEMRKTVPQNGLMHSREEHYWQDMYDQELAKKMTSAGGIGLSSMMYEQLSRNLVSASRTTASARSAASGRAFMPEAAPMFSPSSQDDTGEKTKQPASAHSAMYEGAAQAAPEAAAQPPVSSPASVAAQPPVSSPASVAAQAPLADARQELPAQTPSQAPGEEVDPEVAKALDLMRREKAAREAAQVAQAPAAGTGVQAQAAPSAQRRARPEMNGIDRVNQVRRQAGDQLGSRGVRGPILPQTPRAAAMTEQARQHREAAARHSAQATPQNTPASGPFAPMGQAGEAMPRDASGRSIADSPWMAQANAVQPPAGGAMPAQNAGNAQPPQADGPFAPMGQPGGQQSPAAHAANGRRAQHARRQPRVQDRRSADLQMPIRTLNTDGARPDARAGAGIAAYHESQAQAPQGAPAPAAQNSAAQAGSIPPLTPADIKI